MFFFQPINEQLYYTITVGTLGKHYKNIQKTDRRKVKSINYEAKKFVEKPSIDDRV